MQTLCMAAVFFSRACQLTLQSGKIKIARWSGWVAG